MTNYTRQVTHFACLICPFDEDGNDQWHRRPEFVDQKRRGRNRSHYDATAILRANALSDRWPFLTTGTRAMILRGILTRAGVPLDASWIGEWSRDDAALRRNLVLPIGTDGAAFLRSMGVRR